MSLRAQCLSIASLLSLLIPKTFCQLFSSIITSIGLWTTFQQLILNDTGEMSLTGDWRNIYGWAPSYVESHWKATFCVTAPTNRWASSFLLIYFLLERYWTRQPASSVNRKLIRPHALSVSFLSWTTHSTGNLHPANNSNTWNKSYHLVSVDRLGQDLWGDVMWNTYVPW